MLFHLLDSVAALDPERQVVVAGARREQVESALAGLDVKLVTQEPQLGTAHAVLQAKGVLAGFDGDVLILYGDVPLVTTATMRRMLDRLHEADSPAAVVLGFRPPIRWPMAALSQGQTASSKRWSSSRTRPMPNVRSICATRA